METIQGNLGASTLEIERLRDQTDFLASEITRIEVRSQELEDQREGLMEDAISRADDLIRSGSVEPLEVLSSSSDFSELADRGQLLSEVSGRDAAVFIRLSRTDAELDVLTEDLASRQTALKNSSKELARENKRLQAQFREVASEYQILRRRLAQARARRAPAARSGGGSTPSFKVEVMGDMACPVAGPVSFVDSWGAPRAGHSHEGVDMLSDYGTPVVAIASGTASYVAYDGSGGNMIFLDGDDGNSYWYMHNQENLVSVGQRVEVGEQIATVGDTGNAAGTSHVHFEFHPGGGDAVNPYPLVAPLC